MRGEFSYHGGPANRAPIPACASATLLYATRIIKPAPQGQSTVCRVATINRDEGCEFSHGSGPASIVILPLRGSPLGVGGKVLAGAVLPLRPCSGRGMKRESVTPPAAA